MTPQPVPAGAPRAPDARADGGSGRSAAASPGESAAPEAGLESPLGPARRVFSADVLPERAGNRLPPERPTSPGCPRPRDFRTGARSREVPVVFRGMGTSAWPIPPLSPERERRRGAPARTSGGLPSTRKRKRPAPGRAFSSGSEARPGRPAAHSAMAAGGAALTRRGSSAATRPPTPRQVAKSLSREVSKAPIAAAATKGRLCTIRAMP